MSFIKDRKQKRFVHGKIIHSNKNGWKQIEIWGDAFERGFAHGYLLFKELKRMKKSFVFMVHQNFHVSFEEYVHLCKTKITPIVKTYYNEFYEEICGIVSGAKYKNVILTVDLLIAWNSLSSLFEYFENTRKKNEHCSAFIATGKDITEDGKIVMAHNTHTDLLMGSFFNVVIKINPSSKESGSGFIMQTSAGFIASASDWFICDNGIIGCETTIGDVTYKVDFNKEHHPFFCRIRKAMQYGQSLDDYVNIMTMHNAGDYPCSWLFGNIHTNEIMRFELGLHHHSVERTHQGVYYGMNSVFDEKIRLFETKDADLIDIETSSGSRNQRLHYLLNDKYMGNINKHNAKEILADHYDYFENKQVLNANTVCSHYYMDDPDTSNYPYGCVDGKVTDSSMAMKMEFYGRWGSSCGTAFNVNTYIKNNPEYKNWKNHLVSFPKEPWIVLSSHPSLNVKKLQTKKTKINLHKAKTFKKYKY